MKNKITIVGPVRSNEKKIDGNKSNNLTAFFLMAKYDNEFYNALMLDKERAIEEKGFMFTKSERLIVDSLNEAKLKRFIKTYQIKNISRKSLPSWKSVAAILILISTLAVTGNSCKTKERYSAGCYSDTNKDNLYVQIEPKENHQNESNESE